MSFRTLAATAAVMSLLPVHAIAADSPSAADTRAALEQWLELRKLISEERNEWHQEIEALRTSIQMMERELARIDAEMHTLDETAQATQAQLERLSDEDASLAQTSERIGSVVGELEARVLALHDMFPRELQRQVQPLVARFPRADVVTAQPISTSQRLQNLLGLISEAENFNRTITVVREMQQLPSGESAQIRTLYLGLGAAWFTNDDATYAGTLTPARGGWTVTVRPGLADRIRAAIEIYENEAQPRFVPLPVDIQ